MEEAEDLSVALVEFRQHFDKYYLGAIPRLLNEEGLFLAFISVLTAIECLAGLYKPSKDPGDRFQDFLRAYFQEQYHPLARDLWKFRNLMVHAFNPMPFSIGCHQSRIHLAPLEGTRYLNAEDFYADLVAASRTYFQALYKDASLQEAFARRVSDKGGGRPKTNTFIESVNGNGAAV